MLEKSAFYSSRKITDLLNIIKRHRSLEEKLKIIISGNKFLVKVFVFLFPGVLGTIGGMLPLVIAIVRNMDYADNMQVISHLYELIDMFEVIMILSILLICTLITCYYFLKIVRHKRTFVILTISILIFIFTFSQSFMFAVALF